MGASLLGGGKSKSRESCCFILSHSSVHQSIILVRENQLQWQPQIWHSLFLRNKTLRPLSAQAEGRARQRRRGEGHQDDA
jgi:hypothetical protein